MEGWEGMRGEGSMEKRKFLPAPRNYNELQEIGAGDPFHIW
jgi:hypothetical protein